MKNQKQYKKSDYIIGWIAIIIICLVLLSRCSKSGKDKKEAENTEAATEISTEVENNTTEIIENDKDIILRADHPKYYGETELAHDVWNNIDKDKIHFADSEESITNKTIISMEGEPEFEKNAIIRNVTLYLDHSEDLKDVNLDDALKIAKDYLPDDIINQYYEYIISEKIIPDDGNSSDTYYVITYGFNKEGIEAYNSGQISYDGSIDVILEESKDSNTINQITIDFGKPEWMASLEENGYITEEWLYNFYGEAIPVVSEFVENEALNNFARYVDANQNLNSEELGAYAESQGFVFVLNQLGFGGTTHEYVAYLESDPDNKVFVKYVNPQKEDYADRFQKYTLSYSSISYRKGGALEYYSEWNRDNYSDGRYGYYVGPRQFDTFDEAYSYYTDN